MAKPATRTRGGADETLEMPRDAVAPDINVASRPSSMTVHRSHRRPFGLHPVPLLGGAGIVALLMAIVLLAAGFVIAGVLVLVSAVALLGLCAGGARREPGAPAAEPVRRASKHLRSLAGFATVSGRAWTQAGWQLMRIRRRQYALRRELKATLAPLGEAVHRDDHLRAGELKRKAAAVELKLDESQREASAVIAAVRQKLERERAGIEPTRTVASPPKHST